MTIRLSTGLRNAIVGSTGLAGALANGIIEVYSGAQPLSADNAVAGTLLAVYTKDAGAFTPGSPTNGLTFLAPAAGVLEKSTDNWKAVGLAAGNAGWFRFKGNAVDAGGVSTTALRMDGSVGTSGADMNIPNIVFAIGSPESIDTFRYTQPAQ